MFHTDYTVSKIYKIEIFSSVVRFIQSIARIRRVIILGEGEKKMRPYFIVPPKPNLMNLSNADEIK